MNTQGEFESWLLIQKREFCVAIGSRAAARAFPFLTHVDKADTEEIQLALLSARAILTSAVVAMFPDPILRSASYASSDAAALAVRAAVNARGIRGAAYAAARAASDGAADIADYTSADAAFDAATYAGRAAGENREIVRAAAYADTEVDLNTLTATPIWHETGEPKWLVSTLIPLDDLLEKGSEWSFWREWYRGFLNGKPLDWELQKEIALIPDADWEKGPQHIAGLIEIIRKRRDLEAEIARLKEQLNLAKSAVTLPGRLHNQPPEAVDDAAQILQRDLTVVWGEIDALEKEIAKPDPSPTVLARIASRLAVIAVSIAKYCGSVADAAVKAGAKVIGAAAGAAVVAEAALPGSIQAVAKSILQFVKVLAA